jgi:hypothetical protein
MAASASPSAAGTWSRWAGRRAERLGADLAVANGEQAQLLLAKRWQLQARERTSHGLIGIDLPDPQCLR